MYIPVYLAFIALITIKSYAETYCFDDTTSVNEVYKTVSDFLKPQDDFTLKRHSNCIEINSEESRKGLIDKIIRRNFNVKSMYWNDLEPTKKQCKINISKNKQTKKQNQTLKLSTTLNLKSEKNLDTIDESTSILLSEGLWGSFSINEEEVSVMCLSKAIDVYEISLSVVFNQEKILTNLIVHLGESIEIAELIQNLKSKKTEFATKSGLSNQKVKTKYFLTIH